MTNEQRKLLDSLRELRDIGELHSNDAIDLLEIIDELELELESLSTQFYNLTAIPKDKDYLERRPDHEC